jgi:hypothetical protein
MSRMLEALKQIEAKRSRSQPPANNSPLEIRRVANASVQTLAEFEDQTPSIAEDRSDTDLTGLHPIIQEELDSLHSASSLLKEQIANPPVVQSLKVDSSTIDKTMDRAESALASAISSEAADLSEEPDIYVEMAQYILSQLPPGRPAALLFTSPGDSAGQTETLFLLSKTLANHFSWKVFVLDTLSNVGEMQSEIMHRVSGDWGRLLEQMKTRYQLVLINAPSLAHAQTAAVVSQCDGVYLVIRLGYTTSYDVREAVRVIQQGGGRLLGSIAVGDSLKPQGLEL